ncbi:hypothetical protein DMA11_06125 [Marinilabiliaceae bacterium JC017]|nr:hypothetical protein DMA11_06125 [Marinilabiliaceae bacterium JC017]
MHNKYRNLISVFTVFLLLSFFDLSAQRRTYSPYSRYGLGELQTNGFGRNQSMGGTGIALRNPNHLNDINPASLSSMDSLSFFLEAGIKGFYQKLESNTTEAEFSDITFDYFTLGFPIAKWGGVALGFRPVSNTGYEFSSITENEGTGAVKNSAFGTGNLTKAYFGLGFEPIKNLSLGANFSYIFGNLRHLNFLQFADPNAYIYGNRKQIHVSDIAFDFGAQYTLELNNKNSFTFGATFNPKTALKGDYEDITARGRKLGDKGLLFDESDIDADTLKYDPLTFTGNSMELPMGYGIGFAYEMKDKLVVTADYSFKNWKDSKFPDKLTRTTNSSRYAMGIEFIPNDRSANFYPARIRYRLGGHLLDDYLMIPYSAGKSTEYYQLKDFGISFGLGLPMKRSKTSLNLAFELGQRGTTDNNLIKESYGKFTVNLTLHEYWFMKRKFD